MKFSIKVTLKKDVLDPQGKVVQQTLHNMGMDTLKGLRQGKYFEVFAELLYLVDQVHFFLK